MLPRPRLRQGPRALTRRSTDGRARRVRVVTALTIAAVAFALIQRWGSLQTWDLLDLHVYLEGGEAVLRHEPIYDVEVRASAGDILRFTYPPFAALLFAPLAATGGAAASLLTTASTVAYLAAAAVCARVTRTSLGPGLVLVALGLALEPVQRTLLFGQVNLVLLAVVLVDAFVVPPRWRGFLTGLAVGVKITPGVVIVYWLMRRERRPALQAGGTLLVTVIGGLLVVPGDSQRFWLHDVLALSRFGPEAMSWGNQSAVAVIARASQLHEVPQAVLTSATIASVLTIVALGLLAARRRLALDDSLGALTSIALSGLLLAPISWTHHWVWVVPAIFVFFRERSWWWAVLTSVVFFLPPMWGLANRPTSQLGYSPTELGLASAWLLWAVALLAFWAWPGRALLALEAPAAEPEADVSPPREYPALTSGAETQ